MVSTPAPIPAPAGITLSQMRRYLEGEAERIEICQRELFGADPAKWDAGQRRNRDICKTTVRVLDALASDAASLARVRELTRQAPGGDR